MQIQLMVLLVWFLWWPWINTVGKQKVRWVIHSPWSSQSSSKYKIGLGLHLQSLAREIPEKLDFHEPHCTIASLTPYKHLRRLIRLCYVHVKRNIHECDVPPQVCELMRSLLCITHADWDGTLKTIQEDGGKGGISMIRSYEIVVTLIIFYYQDWVQDKIRSKFTFAAMCWERSFIPLSIWKAGDSNSNLIESVHTDVNREGVRCTLVSRIKKGQAFDTMKMKTLKVKFPPRMLTFTDCWFIGLWEHWNMPIIQLRTFNRKYNKRNKAKMCGLLICSIKWHY